MVKSVIMPKLMPGEDTGFIAKWFVKEGSNVRAGDKLCSIESGKLMQTIMSEFEGTVSKIICSRDAVVKCGEDIAVIEVREAGQSNDGPFIVDITMAGNGVDEIQQWYVKAGDTVKKGSRLYGVEGGKGTQDICSEWEGRIAEILIPEGEKAGAGATVARIEVTGKESGEKPKSIVVIGGGPGGYVAAIRAAQLGADVTLIEKDKLGGTCLHRGCIPTKALLHSAELYHSAKNGAMEGISAQNIELDWKKVKDNKNRISRRMAMGIKSLLDGNGVKLIQGSARFLDSTTIQVDTDAGDRLTMNADRFIIATGSRPVIPPIPGLQGNPDCIDSTGALELEQLPKTMAIIGGGVIGVELACVYALLGVSVTVIEMMDRLLPSMDQELTKIAQKQMEKTGIKFMLQSQVKAVTQENGETVLKVKAADGSERRITAGKVIAAVGRRPDCSGICAEAAGIAVEKSHIVVNGKMETNVPGIYAIGDCTGRIMLAHTASAMGETAAENAVGKEAVYSEAACPSCVYIHPEFAAVGLTEEAAKQQGKKYTAGKFPLAANGKSVIMGADCGWIKIITDSDSGRIIGMHIFGPRATDIIAEGALAIKMRAKTEDIISTIHAHPTVAEAVREAALAVQGRAIHYK